MFVADGHFLPSLIFSGKVGAYQNGAPYRLHSKGELCKNFQRIISYSDILYPCIYLILKSYFFKITNFDLVMDIHFQANILYILQIKVLVLLSLN